MSIEAYDYGKQDGALEEQEALIALLKDLLKDTEEPMLGTKGGWREYLISKIKERRTGLKISLTPEEYEFLEKTLDEPAEPNERLRKLLNGDKESD